VRHTSGACSGTIVSQSVIRLPPADRDPLSVLSHNPSISLHAHVHADRTRVVGVGASFRDACDGAVESIGEASLREGESADEPLCGRGVTWQTAQQELRPPFARGIDAAHREIRPPTLARRLKPPLPVLSLAQARGAFGRGSAGASPSLCARNRRGSSGDSPSRSFALPELRAPGGSASRSFARPELWPPGASPSRRALRGPGGAWPVLERLGGEAA
jgi:hypothetical protein